MKRCPYCAEEIQDAAIKCRWCGSDLTLPPQKVIANPPQASRPAETEQSPAPVDTGQQPVATTPSEAVASESAATGESAVQATSTPDAVTEPMTTAAASSRAPEILSPPRTPSPNATITFSHEGPRYLLGYTPQYYGIWDKQGPGPPAQKFARTDQGWQQAWEAFIRLEMGQT